MAQEEEQKPKIDYVLFDMDGLLMYASSSLSSIFIFIIYLTCGGDPVLCYPRSLGD